MNHYIKTFIFYSLFFAINFLEAQTVSNDQPIKSVLSQSLRPVYRDFFIENTSDKPLLDWCPSTTQHQIFSKEKLQAFVNNSSYPILDLFALWKRVVVLAEDAQPYLGHPLDLLNFSIPCNNSDFEHQFIRLCQDLGVKVRRPNVYQESCYDFSFQHGEWNFFDVRNEQFYLGFDNKTLASSEDIMDDPLLALRTQHQRCESEMNFKEAWKKLATFEILEPASAPTLVSELLPEVRSFHGYDLYPKESLNYQMTHSNNNDSLIQYQVTHNVNLANRESGISFDYDSPIPLKQLTNKSSCAVYVVELNKTLGIGESTYLDDLALFKLSLVFSEIPKGELLFSGNILFSEANPFDFESIQHSSQIRSEHSVYETNLRVPSRMIQCTNENPLFDFVSPTFNVQASNPSITKMRWQISPTKDFSFVPANLDRLQFFSDTITLSEIDQTFLEPTETYYFRIKGCENDIWSDWSEIFEFKVEKPLSVEKIELDEVDTHTFEISWERFAPLENQNIKYYVFGSNSFDFIPQIYYDKQIDHIKGDTIVREDPNSNLVTVTKKAKITVSSSFAYYRIIAYQNGKFSNPSSIVHIFASNLYQPRNVLQIYNESNPFEAKRMLFPSMSSNDLLFSSKYTGLREVSTCNLQELLFSASTIDIINPRYQENPAHISPEVWNAVQPWLMPDNHPCKAVLDRLATESRFIKDSASMKNAGFPRADRIGRVSRVCASPHREMPEYYFKVYHDAELTIKYDWKRWVHRCEGAEVIRKCIKKNGLSSRFRVPHKWIYCWPAFGKQLNNPSRYSPKNFILVCENMRICEHKENQRLFKKKIDEKWMDGIYTILQTCGLCDSVYCFNIPFNKDGKICIIDTEFWHKWKVPFERLTKCFSSKKKDYWKKLTTSNRIPDGVNSPNNMPRLDRRDRE